MIHFEASQFTGEKVRVKPDGMDFKVEDWWDRVYGQAWSFAALNDGNFAALAYGSRAAQQDLPQDNEVLYGKDMGGLGHLIHVSEIEKKAAKLME